MWLTVMIFIEPPTSFIQISPLRRSMVAYLGSYKKSRQKNLSPDSRSVEMLEHHVRAGNRV
jgi:hypothetical protein